MIALTSREWDVLYGISEGKTDAQTAAELFLSVHTIKAHVSSLFQKLGAKTRGQAVALAYHQGLLVPARVLA